MKNVLLVLLVGLMALPQPVHGIVYEGRVVNPIGDMERNCFDGMEPATLEVLKRVLLTQIEDRHAQVRSASDLAAFFIEILGLRPDNDLIPQVVGLADYVYNNSRGEVLHEVLYSLSYSLPHKASGQLYHAFMLFARKEYSSAADILKVLTFRPISPEDFLTWLSYGLHMESNSDFRSKLNMAVNDYKDFNLRLKDLRILYGTDLFQDFRRLQNRPLVGKFVQMFTTADRLTRQYMVGLVSRPGPGDESGEYSLRLSRYPQVDVLEEVLNKGLEVLQEEAYFVQIGEGGLRPKLPTDTTLVKNIAIRHIKRHGLNLTLGSSFYASMILADYPKFDNEVTNTLNRLLNPLSESSSKLRTFYAEKYAILEIKLLARFAQGFSAWMPDMEISYGLLAGEGRTDFLLEVLRFYTSFGHMNFPSLDKSVFAFFQQHPSRLESLMALAPDEVNHFKREIYRRTRNRP